MSIYNNKFSFSLPVLVLRLGKDLKTALLFFTISVFREFCKEYFFLLLVGHSIFKANMLFLDKSDEFMEVFTSFLGVSHRSSTCTSAFCMEETLLLQHFA